LVSHADGIHPFLRHFGWGGSAVHDPCPCYTAAVELENTLAGGYKILDIKIVNQKAFSYSDSPKHMETYKKSHAKRLGRFF